VAPLESVITTVLAVTASVYGIAGLLALCRLRGIALAAFLLGVLGNTALFVLNWCACNEPPLGNMYHVLSFLPLCLLPCYAVLRLRDRLDRLLPHFAFAAVVPLVGCFFLKRDVFWDRMPALQSFWFVPHVVSYMISYALATVAFFVVAWGYIYGGLRVLFLWVVHGTARYDWEDAARRGEAAYRMVLLALPFMTFGMLSGAVWAEQAWGGYWSWDPKENWSLVTWTLYVIYLHARRKPAWRRWADAVHIMAFVALFVTFILVNLLPKLGSVLHSYA
jgi:cytochrome c-type biogenesis protein CcsB